MQDLQISSQFYHDEVRCGFYIPTAIKQSWATALMILEEIDRICQKHNIEYFADWGTLIGTVRHGGFVPWDDDLDICMKREDYIKFRKVVDKELPAGYGIHDYERQEDHLFFIARVVNTVHMRFDKEHLDKYHNYPYIGAIDIFVQDYMYQDPEKERERCEYIKYLLALADSVIEGSVSCDYLKANLIDIKNRFGISISMEQSPRDILIDIYKLIEMRMAEVKSEESDRLVQIFPWGLKGAKGLPKAYYEKTVRLPFECMTIPVPQCYNRVLRDRYGDYLMARKIWSGHNYPAFEGQKANLQAVADFKLPEFEFDSAMLVRRNSSDENSIKCVAGSFEKYLSRLHVEIEGIMISYKSNISEVSKGENATDSFTIDRVQEMLSDCQQLAVDFGGLIEDTKGETTVSVKRIVGGLEGYCESIYNLYNALPNGMIDDLNSCLESLKDLIEANIYGRNSILFVADGTGRVAELRILIEEEASELSNDVYVTVAPSFFKDIYGSIIASDEEIDNSIEQTKDAYEALGNLMSEYDNVSVVSWDKVDVETLHPERIYYQNPYDSKNPCLTVPTHLYALNMRKYTEQLIYVAPKTDDFGIRDINDIYNMKHYVTAPGVILADKIYVQSYNMKQMYVMKLTEFAGDKNKSFWDDKIEIRNDVFAEIWKNSEIKHKDKQNANMLTYEGDNDKKHLLYVIGLNEEYEHDKDKLLEAIKRRDGLFEQYKDKIDVTRLRYPDEACIDVTDFDAYYGSPSPYVLEFTRAGKPVMIADFEV